MNACNQRVLRNQNLHVLEYHFPEHFHAEYGEFKALISIRDAVVINGALPAKQLELVLAWCEIHRDELMTNWTNAQKHAEIVKIEPLR